MRIDENSNVKEWYKKTYNTDKLGNDINGQITFYDIFYALDRYKNIYDVIGVDDSIIRERIFEQLAKIMDCSYDYIYNQWLLSEEV